MNRDTTIQFEESYRALEAKVQSLEEFIKVSWNILEDSALEKLRFEDTQRSILNHGCPIIS